MTFRIHPMTEIEAHEIISWRYDPPYSFYDLTEEHLPELITEDNRYYAIHDENGTLVGLCCFGTEARVQGGDYLRKEPEVIDIGLGLRPNLTGRGLGKRMLLSILDFAYENFSPDRFRATIAQFNLRSIRTFQALGFSMTHSFIRPEDRLRFLQLERDACLEEETVSSVQG